MENEKFVVNLPEGATEVIIREGSAAPQLENKAPLKINYFGTLGSVAEFLGKRVPKDMFKQQDCAILVDRDEMTIKLLINETDAYTNGVVGGCLSVSTELKELGVNIGYKWTPEELAMAFKMHRAWFSDIKTNMELVTTLKNFKANVSNKVERSIEENGSKADIFSQVVDSNLPKAFSLHIPVLKGYAPADIEVETFANVDGRNVQFILLSPGAQEVLERERDTAIDGELAKIREIAPDIVIIEQ